MRHHFFSALGLVFSTLLLAGCGITSHLGGTPSSDRHNPTSAIVQPSSRSRMPSAPPSSSLASTSTTSLTASRPNIAGTSSLDTAIAVAIHSQVQMPVELPTFIPSIDSHPSWSLTATTQQSPHSYQVMFWRSATALPINSAQIPSSPHVWIATIQGSHYASTTKAYTALQTQAAPTWIPLTRLGSSIALKSGIVARLYPSGVLQWTVGSWTMQLSEGSRAADVTVAESLLATISPASLPATHGLLAATATAQGEQFQATWVIGSNVYDFTPFTQQIQGNGIIYDRMLSGKSSQSLFLHILLDVGK